jgi:hypothetical protein
LSVRDYQARAPAYRGRARVMLVCMSTEGLNGAWPTKSLIGHGGRRPRRPARRTSRGRRDGESVSRVKRIALEKEKGQVFAV